jgi:outer membrane protein assembly factor BamB/TolB-like protein
MKKLLHLLCLAICFLMPVAALAASRPKTLAVVDFQNASGDRSLDSIGLGIMEEISTDLAGVRGVNLIERRELNVVLKELKFDRSQYVDRVTAQKIGKLLGADYMVVGGYQKFQDDIRLTARLVEVETGKDLLGAKAQGKYSNLMGLQDQLAESLRKGVAGGFAEEESSPVAPSTTNLEAFQDFSDGLKLYRDELFADAAAKFDAALKQDPQYSRAHFYKGLALEKQYRWEDAAQSFKNALLGAEGTSRQMWEWDVPYQKPGSQRAVGAIVFSLTKEERDLKKKSGDEEDDISILANARRFVFGEKLGKTSVLYFVNPFTRSFKQVPLPDPDAAQYVYGRETSGIAIFNVEGGGDPASMTIKRYGIDPDEGVLRWQFKYQVNGGTIGWYNTDTSIYTYSSQGVIVAQDKATGQERWKKSLTIDFFRGDIFDVAGYGDVGAVCATNPAKLYFLRGSDGSEMWNLKGDCEDWDMEHVGQNLLILDAKAGLVRGYRAVNGQKLFDLPISLQRVKYGIEGEHVVYAVKENTLYVAGKDRMLYALAFSEKAPANNRLLWKAPIDVRRDLFATRDRILAVTKDGYLVLVDRSSGKVENKIRIGDEDVFPIHARGDLAIFRVESSNRIFGVDLKKGEKTWECKTWQQDGRGVYMQGMLLFQSGKKEITALNAATGVTLWHHLGEKAPIVIPGKDSVFVGDVAGVKEYIAPKPDPGTSLAQAEVVTQLAQCLFQLNRPDEALTQAQRVVRELDPDYPEAHLMLARIYGQRGDRENRQRELLAYYSLVDPTNPLAQHIFQELKTNFGLKWRTDVEQADEMASDSAGKFLHLWGDSGLHTVLDPESGGFVWHERGDPNAWTLWRPTQPIILVTRPSEDSKTIQLWQVDATSGEKKMLSSVDLQEIPSFIAYTASKQQILLWASGGTLFGPQHWRLFCVDIASGKLLWQTKYDGKPDDYLIGAVAGEKQVVYAAGTTLHAIAPATGQPLAQGSSESQITSLAQSLGDPSEVYFTFGDRQLGVFDAATGKVSRTIDLPQGDYTHWLFPDRLRGSAFYLYAPHEILAMDLGANPRQKDRILWRFPLPEEHRVERIRVEGDKIYCLRDDDTLAELDAESGRLLAEYPLLWDASYFLVQGDTFYGLSSDGYAYAMKLAPLAGLP